MADAGIDLQDPRITDYPGTGDLPAGALLFVQNPTTRKSHRATVGRVRGAGSGGTDTPFDITPTESLGGVEAGRLYDDVTPEQMIRALLVKYQAPGFAFFTIGNAGSRTVPVGTQFPAGFKSVAWATSNSGNVRANSITVRDVTANTILAGNEANDGTASLSTASFTAGLGLARVYLISGVNSNGAAFSRDISIYGAYYVYFGATAAAPTNSATVQALPSRLTSEGDQFTLNTGTQQRVFALELPPGKSLVSVIDQDALNKDITAEYVAGSPIQVADASGGQAAYTPRVKVQAAPYDTNHRHLITLG